jgi:hypothetical protein
MDEPLGEACTVLSERLLEELSKRIRAGAYEQVAAQTMGVPLELYQDWLLQGRRPDGPDLCRRLVRVVEQAKAHARCMAEMDMRTKHPRIWLLHGPGRETNELPGWSAQAKARPDSARRLNVLEHPEVVALFALVKEVLKSFPEALAAVLKALEEAGLIWP